MDVMELGQIDPRTVVSLALARIAQGNVDSAISLVEANRSIVPASDYGLTLALAGQSGRAVEVLSDAIRADNASARTRQNLALVGKPLMTCLASPETRGIPNLRRLVLLVVRRWHWPRAWRGWRMALILVVPCATPPVFVAWLD